MVAWYAVWLSVGSLGDMVADDKKDRNISNIPSCKKKKIDLETGKGDGKLSVCSSFPSVCFTVSFLTCISELSLQ